MPPRWVEALQRGSIVFGKIELAPGAKLSDAARALGFEASTADRYTVTTPVLGFAAQPVELVFVRNKLHTVRCADPAWKSTGTSWDDYDPAIDVANFHATEK